MREILSWRNLFIATIGFLGLFLVLMVYVVHHDQDREESFELLARQHLHAHTKRNALLPIIEALEQVHWDVLAANRELLQAAALENKNLDSPTLDAILKKHQSAIASITRSADIPIVSLPSTVNANLDTPQPRIDDMQNLGFMLVANAKRLAAEGRSEEALQRLMETALLGSRFCRPRDEASLSRHIVGMTLMEMSVSSMPPVLRNPELDIDTRLKIAEQLREVESSFASVEEGLRANLLLVEQEISSRFDDPVRLVEAMQILQPDVDQSEHTELARKYTGDPSEYLNASAELHEKIDAFLKSQPDFSRRIDKEWFEKNAGHPMLKCHFTEWSALLVRDASIRCRIRLTRLLAVHQITDKKESEELLDPFDGMPLRVANNMIYSVGPDGVDDGGKKIYDQGNGVFSDGDITLAISQ